MKVCLDFDGVLHDAAHPVAGRRMGPPLEGALGAVLLLLDDGHTVVLHSSRAQMPTQSQHIFDWLTYYGFPQLTVYVHKPVADVYLDDKGLHFTDWATALSQLEEVAGNGSVRQHASGRPSTRGRDRQRGARLPRTRLSGPADG